MEATQIFSGLTLAQIAMFAIFIGIIVYYKIFTTPNHCRDIIKEELKDHGVVTQTDLVNHQLNCRKAHEDEFAKKEALAELKDVIHELRQDNKVMNDQLMSINRNISDFKSDIKQEVTKFVYAYEQIGKLLENAITSNINKK